MDKKALPNVIKLKYSCNYQKQPLEVFYKKGALKTYVKFTGVLKSFAKFTRKHLCQVSFLIKLQVEPCNFTKKETLVQVFSCEFYKISKNTFFIVTEHLRKTLSELSSLLSSLFRNFRILLFMLLTYNLQIWFI